MFLMNFVQLICTVKNTNGWDVRGDNMNNNFSTILGSRLLKISDVYEKTGISRTTLTSIYYRKAENIQLKTLIEICDFLDVSLSELIEYHPQKVTTS